jgi:hypothetical protein
VSPEYFPPLAAEMAAASFSWSKAGLRIAVAASTQTNSVPPLTDREYQK